MARKHKPACGWDYHGLDGKTPDELFALIYSEDHIDRIIAECGIQDPYHIVRLKDVLRDGIVLYRSHRAGDPDRPTAHQVRGWWSEFDQAMRTGAHALRNIDGVSRGLFNKTHVMNVVAISEGSRDHDLEGYSNKNRFNDVHFDAESHILEALELAESIAARMKAELPPLVRGPRQNVALYDWVRSLSDFWVKRLGRQVTLDRGLPASRSPFHRFCELALEPIDEEAVPSLPHAIDKVRAQPTY